MMKRNAAILLLLLLLASLPPLGVGYFNLYRAENLRQHTPSQASARYETAARLLFWQRGLFEKAGLAAFEAGEVERAYPLLLDARQRETLSSEGLFALGEMYQQKGDYDSAYTQAWLPLSETGYASPALSTRLAGYAAYKRDLPLEIFHLTRLIEQEPDNAPALYRLGILLTTDSPEAALASLKQAEILDTSFQPNIKILRGALEAALSQDDPAYRHIVTGRALASLGEWQLALNAFRATAQSNPNYAEAWAWQAEALFQLGEETTTIESLYEKALALNPDAAGIHAMTGLYWERRGDYPQAEALYQRAIQLEASNPAWRLALAGVVARRDLPAALELYLAATELGPDSSSTWYALAVFCVENEAYLQNYGLDAALRAYALEPDNPLMMDLLGRALTASGEAESAQVMYEKAIAAAPGLPAPHFHLALLHLQTNRRAAAKAGFEQTMRLDPAGPYSAQAQNILERYFP